MEIYLELTKLGKMSIIYVEVLAAEPLLAENDMDPSDSEGAKDVLIEDTPTEDYLKR